MNIKENSTILLKEIYNLLNEKSSSLIVNVPLISIAQKLNISHENANLCLGYLKDKGCVKCDTAFLAHADVRTLKEITLTATGIDLIESEI